MNHALIELRNLNVTFGRQILFQPDQKVEAVSDVSLKIYPGEIVALVGESGCGKTTLGRVIAGLQNPTDGALLWEGRDINKMSRREFTDYRLGVQIVHQDSFAALNPVRTILQTLSAPLRRHGFAKNSRQARARAAELIESMGLTPADLFLEKYPHQLSGGQRQRVVLARAMSAEPKLIVADEPVSMVDVSLRLSLLNLMSELNERQDLAFLYITHDLATARYFAQQGRIVVMYLGHIMELGPLGDTIAHPYHPYLLALLSAVLVPDPRITREKRQLPLTSLEIPDPAHAPEGCRFHTRCPYAKPICAEEHPPLKPTDRPDHLVSCHFWKEIAE